MEYGQGKSWQAPRAGEKIPKGSVEWKEWIRLRVVIARVGSRGRIATKLKHTGWL